MTHSKRIPHERSVEQRDFMIAIPAALVFLGLFALLQKLGLVNLIGGNTGYGTAFVVGVIASLSTCMAVVGGLVLSVSASYAERGTGLTPHITFHIARLVGFFVLGGVIGTLGGIFTLGATATLVLGIAVGLVMLILGVNLLGVSRITKRLLPTLPRSFAHFVESSTRAHHVVAPLLAGVATFFLPCGFTQSMQLYALSTGSFTTGAFTMFAFALGTLPALALLSAGSWSIHRSPYAGAFFKAAGLVVIAFALFNIANALKSAGIIHPITFAPVNTGSHTTIANNLQRIEITAHGGYSPREIIAKADMPLTLTMRTENTFDCSSSVAIPAINYRANLPQTGTTEIAIPAQKSGTEIRGTCGMGMYNFTIRFK